LHYAFGRFRDVGVPVPTTSRLAQARELLEKMVAKSIDVTKSVKLRRDLAEAQKAATEFYQLARAINPRAGPASPNLRRDLQRAYGGRLNPAAQDTVSVAARNLQFQLWLAAWFVAGGRDLRYEEPDLRVTYWFRWHGVAAKRIQTPSKIVRRVKEAARQVKNRVGSGFVAVSFDNYSPLLSKRFARLRDPTRYFDRLPELRRAVEWCRDEAPWIRAILAFGALAQWRLRSRPPHLTLSFPEQVMCIARDRRDEENLADYFKEIHGTYRRNVGIL
jgi:hypothetical protein